MAASRKLPASFRRFARLGSSPTTERPRPSACKTGLAASSASVGPAATTQSLACAAISGRPNTGAATYRLPCARWASARRREVAGSTVLIPTWTASRPSPARRPLSPNATASRAASSATIVITIRDSRAAAAGEPAQVAPSPRSSSARARVRLWTVRA